MAYFGSSLSWTGGDELPDDIMTVLDDNIQITAAGMLYSDNLERFSDSNYEKLKESIKDLRETGWLGKAKDSIYAYYYSGDELAESEFGVGDNFSIRMHCNSGERWGVCWFRVNVGSEDLVLFGTVQHFKFGAT